MGQIKHHLSEALLMGYSAGTLPEAFNLVVASHVSMCDTCRAALAAYDSVGGALLADEAAPLADDSFAQTMARIARSPKDPIVTTPTRNAVFPAPLQDYVGGDLDAVTWRNVGGGVQQAILHTSKDASARLLRIPGGTKIPDHGHRGLELTLVLQGAFSDEEDRFGRGDIEVANEDVHHTPYAEPGEVCICLAATDAPLRFAGLLPKMLQPFVRM